MKIPEFKSKRVMNLQVDAAAEITNEYLVRLVKVYMEDNLPIIASVLDDSRKYIILRGQQVQPHDVRRHDEEVPR